MIYTSESTCAVMGTSSLFEQTVMKINSVEMDVVPRCPVYMHRRARRHFDSYVYKHMKTAFSRIRHSYLTAQARESLMKGVFSCQTVGTASGVDWLFCRQIFNKHADRNDQYQMTLSFACRRYLCSVPRGGLETGRNVAMSSDILHSHTT